MTDQTVDDAPEAEEEESEDAGLPTRKWSGKRIVLFIVLPLLLMAGGGAGAYFSGLLSFVGLAAPGAEAPAEDAGPAEPVDPVFLDLPELLVNLNTTGRRASFLKIKISLELHSEKDIPRLEAVMPRIVDNFQVYLRELRAEDLRGSAGLYRLREELLMRVQKAARPAQVHDILFREMLVQ